MKPLNRIVTAVDYSEPARAAFDRALAISRRHHAELTVVHAVPKDRPFRWLARERIAMIAALRQAAKEADVRFEVSVQHGDPASVILLQARTRRPDLIVLGTHQRSGFDRVRRGSVAETVTLRASQPVLIVPESSAAGTADPVQPIDSILAAVDFSAGSNAAVERALSMINPTSRVTLVHVVPGIPLAQASRYSYHLNEPEYQRVLARDAWRRLQGTISTHATRPGTVRARVASGDPSTEIARVAEEVDADMILVGVTPRGAIGRRVFGSTAARVIRTAARPVLAIPERGEEGLGAESEGSQLAIAA
jgi:nucleotide-binding universal stress UspA family protein